MCSKKNILDKEYNIYCDILLLRKAVAHDQKCTTKERLLDMRSYPGRDGGRVYLCYVSQIERKQDMNPTSMG